jgi:hypothetical protein
VFDWVFSGIISSTNLCLDDLLWKSEFLFRISIISFLGDTYIGQSSRKCTSSSTTVGQNGQNLFSFGVLGMVCLNFSMFNRLFESLNFVNDFLISLFFISCKYFSHPTFFLKRAYVRSLLSGFVMAWKESWWNFSICLDCSSLWIGECFFGCLFWRGCVFCKVARLCDWRIDCMCVIYGSFSPIAFGRLLARIGFTFTWIILFQFSIAAVIVKKKKLK